MSTEEGDAADAAPEAHQAHPGHRNELLRAGDNTSNPEVHTTEQLKSQGHDTNESGRGSIYYDASGIRERSYGASDDTETRYQPDSGSEDGGVKLKGKETINMQLEETQKAAGGEGSFVSQTSGGVHVEEEVHGPESTTTQLAQEGRATKPLPSGKFYPSYYPVPDIQLNANPNPNGGPSGEDLTRSTFTRTPDTRLPPVGVQGNTGEDRRNWERIQASAGFPTGRYNYEPGEVAIFPSYPAPEPSRVAQKRKSSSNDNARGLNNTGSIASDARPGHLRPPTYDESSSSSGRNNPISSQISLARQREDQQSREEVVVPRWQPDAEVTFCPICATQFSFFVRKHHCRKCGRVVCNACSPHRITIPYQFIVQPPTESDTLNSSRARPTLDPAHAGSSSEFESLGGGERVRLCNPCVPDPNTAPPQAPQFKNQPQIIPRNVHSRSASSVNTYTIPSQPTLSSSNPSERPTADDLRNFRRRPRHTSILGRQPGDTSNSTGPHIPYNTHPNTSNNAYSNQAYADPRARSSTVSGGAVHLNQNPTRPTVPGLSARVSGGPASIRSFVPRTEHHERPLPRIPRPPRIAEEDECPVCHQELPSSQLPNSEALRAAHITNCIENAMQGTSSTPSPPPTTSTSSQIRASATPSSSTSIPAPIANTPEARMAAREQAHAAVVLGQRSSPSPAFRRTGVFPYKATEKDCVDDAECTICLEEFEVGQDMGRLECFCRFHLHCIRGWFVDHYGQCPVHHQAY